MALLYLWNVWNNIIHEGVVGKGADLSTLKMSGVYKSKIKETT